MRFQDRAEAGRKLADKLRDYEDRSDVLVLGLPRGGVPVAFEVAHELNVPLDVFVVRKLGMPGHEELAMGAVATGGARVLNEEVVQAWQVSDETIDAVTDKEMRELKRREHAYRGDRSYPEIESKIVILVDDGLATGATMRAAVAGIKQQNPARIIVAVPTASPQVCAEFEDLVDETICAITPEPFRAVGLWYRDFSQTTDSEVQTLLEHAAQESEIA